MQARYYGPYTIDKKLSDVNYIVNTPGRRKQKQLCHINMLKKYIDRDSSVISSVNLVNTVPLEQNQMDSEDMNFVKSDPASSKLKNSDILKDLDQKLSHNYFLLLIVNDNFVFNKFCYILKVLFADFPNSKFWFPEFVSLYAWHVTLERKSGISKLWAFSICI